MQNCINIKSYLLVEWFYRPYQKFKSLRLSSKYQISREPLTDQTTSHHFVNDGSRASFFTDGLKKLKSAGFIKETA